MCFSIWTRGFVSFSKKWEHFTLCNLKLFRPHVTTGCSCLAVPVFHKLGWLNLHYSSARILLPHLLGNLFRMKTLALLWLFFSLAFIKIKKKKAQASKIKICRHKAVVFTLLLSKGAGRIKWWKFLVLVPCKARRSHSLCSILHLHYFRLETNYLTGHSLKKMTPWINCCEYNWWWDIKDANKSTQHIKVIMCSNSAL